MPLRIQVATKFRTGLCDCVHQRGVSICTGGQVSVRQAQRAQRDNRARVSPLHLLVFSHAFGSREISQFFMAAKI